MLRADYGEASVSSVLNATIDGKLMMGYSNPYTSATGLNFLLAALASSGSDTIVDTAAVENFQRFQTNVPLVSFTTQQMVQSADKGIVDGVVMEYQSYQNDPTLQRNYEFIPFGVRHDTQDSTEDIQYQAYVALVEDFKELIDTTVKAGKDSYKHVDLFDGKSLEESVTHTVPLDDDKAQFLAAACMDLANSTLWLYHHNNQFQDTEFAEVVNNDYPKYQIQVQQEMNGEGERFYLRGWYPLVQKISRECQLKAYEGYKPKEQMTYVNIYLLVYAAMKSLKNGSLSRIMANIEHDSDKIGNLAFYFFTYILEVLEMPL